MASVDIRPATPSKFQKCTLDLSDIDRAKPNLGKYERNYKRNGLNVTDVPGATPTVRTNQRKTAYDSFLYNDVHKPQIKH